MSLFNLPPFVVGLLPFLGAVALAVIVYLVVDPYINRSLQSRNANRLGDMADGRSLSHAIRERAGSSNYKIRIFFARYGFDAAGNENLYLWIARVGIGAAAAIILIIVGLPLFTSLVGLAMGYVFVNGLVSQSWSKVKSDAESEIPTFLSSMASSLKVTQNVVSSTEKVADTLNRGGPLRAWAMELSSTMMAKGVPLAIEEARAEAEEYSPSLVVVLALLQRAHLVGGEGYHTAFVSAAENMESVLDARVNARAVGSGGRNVLYFMLAIAVFLSALSLRSDALSSITASPMIQLMYAGIYMMMTYGLVYINNLIDTVV